MSVDTLIRFFETLSAGSVSRIPELYAEDAYFKDPFNEVRGAPAIQRIFSHMFTQVSAPRFVVEERIVDGRGAVLVWDFHFGVRVWGRVRAQVIHGVSHLKFAADGKVAWHRDYWDTGEELYMKLPVLGLLLRALRRRLSA
jgi:steroid Delta-isomerase